jgi:hypothetical protein
VLGGTRDPVRADAAASDVGVSTLDLKRETHNVQIWEEVGGKQPLVPDQP